MANNPKKVKDPTEVALSAIQEALNISEPRPSADGDAVRFNDPPLAPQYQQDFEARRDERVFETVDTHVYQPRPANDDRETIGQILQALQRGRPGRSAYTIATVFAGVWIVGCGLLTISFLPSLQSFIGQGSGGLLALAGLVALFLAPVLLVYLLAALAWRGQELGVIAQSMAQVAIRFSEPEGAASDSMVTVGQAIRREVAAMGDGVERAIARASELETLVTNEVAALERAYSDNEVRIRALLQDIAAQRDNLVGQAEQVRNAISGVQIDLRHDIALISDAIASRVDEVAQSITSALQERGDHITNALGTAGDNMILALGERGGDLLDRLEEASSETTRAVLDASERLTTSLNFKTGSVHDEFVDLADRVHEMLTERVERVTGDFEKRAAEIIDSVAGRSEQVHDSLKNSTDSLLLELELRSGDLVTKVDDAGGRMAERILLSGDKARDSLDATVNSLIERVVTQTETAHDALSNQMSAFDELMKDQGSDLAERFARDSSTLGALITRHVSEFDRTVKTFGGEIVDRMGERTQTIADSLKTYVDTFDSRVTSNGGEISAALDQRLLQFHTTLDARVTNLDTSLDSRIRSFDQTVEGRVKALEESFDTRTRAVTETLDTRLSSIATSLLEGSSSAVDAVTQRVDSVTQAIDTRTAHLADTINARFQNVQQGFDSRATNVVLEIETRVAQFEDLLGSRVEAVASRIETSGREASDTLVTRAQELSLGIRSHVDDAERVLSQLVQNSGQSIETSARAAQQSLLGMSSEVATQIRDASSESERLLASAGASTAAAIANSTREAQTTLLEASSGAAAQIRQASSETERVLESISATTTAVMVNGTRDAQSTLLEASSAAASQIKTLAADVERSLSTAGTTTSSSILSSAREAQETLLRSSGAATEQIRQLSGEIERSLTTASTTTSSSILSSAREAYETLIRSSGDTTEQIRQLSGEIERSLTAAGTTTSSTILSSAREAQETLLRSSGDTAEQMKQLSDEIERSLTTTAAATSDSILTTARSSQASLVSVGNDITHQIRTASADIERAVVSSAASFGSAMTGKSEEIVTTVEQHTVRLHQLIDERRGLLVEGMSERAQLISQDMSRVTADALKSIEGKGLALAQGLANQGSDVARMINAASEIATGSVNKSLRDIEQTTRTAIEQSRQVASSAVTEMQETSKILRTDTVALFERLREGNILLQEVLTGSHDNLNALEKALVSRVADFVSTMNDVTSRHGSSTGLLEEKLTHFTLTTGRALQDLNALSGQFELHGRTLVDAAALVERSNASTTESVTERKAALESLVTTIDLRTADLDQRLSRFTDLLDESLAAAESRARDIARVVAETAGAGASSISRQFEAVRASAEEERRLTSEAMTDIYQQGMQEADAMFKQSADRFTLVVQGMKEMAGEMQQELEATRTELRRGVLEIPQEAAEGTAQMRKVIVDQIEALAELNRIVARHGRGLDVVSTGSRAAPAYREEEPAMVAAGARAEPAQARPQSQPQRSSTNLPPPDFGTPVPSSRRTEAPPMSPDANENRDGWLSDLLSRADTDREPPRPRAQQPAAPANPLEALSLDIARLMDRNIAGDMWERYQRGDRKAFTKRLYTPNGQKAFDEVNRKYRGDRAFKQAADRYITEFERVLDEVSRDERTGPDALRSYLTSETGLVYTLLAHAAGRLA